ncbi:hypothetical protein [Oceanisphaera psychrotolerans]|uniref:Alpha/beta hydrolase n=1 Tax=Oceanisphaera psychrotolerans TaxID=1414654 RepID=A0A1J4QEE0_9GAMM|nr:hypothetical protein [Oceanisphaera psychrotolerans]OIN07994.1 hypothetical protein BFR47_15880 [Oceanisphaera psychrotolerans]
MTVKQRQVLYIHGFDPRGAGHYHRLYCSQSAQQAAVNGLNITVSRRHRRAVHSHHWQLHTTQTRTNYCYLGWDDLVRRNWSKGWRQIMSDLYVVILAYLASGNIVTFARASHRQMIAGFYPVLYLLLGAGASAALSVFVTSWLPLPALPDTVQYVLAWLIGISCFCLCMQALKTLGDRLAVFWLLRIYAFSAKWAVNQIPHVNERTERFADDIIKAIQNPDNDEVVIIAHSVGTMMVVPALARALAALPDGSAFANQRVVLITLGQCIPLLSFQPGAHDFRAALEQLGQDSRLLWLDYTAPTDGACFPLLDPVTSCGLTRVAQAGPRLLSPRFFTLYHPARYKKLRRAWYSMHFLYLMATDKPGPYDFFAFTAGPRTIAHQVEEPS